MSPEERSDLARMAVLIRWSRTTNRSQATEPGRMGLWRRYLPENYDELDPKLQATLLESAKRAHASRMRAAKQRKRDETSE